LKSKELILVVLLLVLFAILSGSGAVSDSLTYDEPAHFRYGKQILSGDATRFDDSKMPVTSLNVLPVEFTKAVFPSVLAGKWQIERVGRISSIVAGLLLGVLIYRWSKELYGTLAGLISLFLFSLEPNLIAHAHLITTDIYATLFATLSVYCFWKFSNRISFSSGLMSALVLGLAQITKYTSIFLYPLLLVIAIARFGPVAYQRIRLHRWREFLLGFGRFSIYFLLFAAVGLVIINVGFLFDRTLTPFGAYVFQSDLFNQIQESLRSMAKLPVPLPYSYVEGLDLVRFRERTGYGFGSIYLLGNIRKNRLFPGYFFVATLIKMPIVTQLLLLGALIQYVRKLRLSEFFIREWYLAAPIAFFSIYFNFFYKAQIGIRYYLIIFPVLLIFAGSTFNNRVIASLRQPFLVYAGIVYLLSSVLSFYPTYIPYVNEIILNRTHIYKYLGDSNVDWGQSEGYLAEYLERNPDAIVDPQQPTNGTIIVSINRLVGVRGGPETYRWLRSKYDPVDQIAYSYLVYEIPAIEPGTVP